MLNASRYMNGLSEPQFVGIMAPWSALAFGVSLEALCFITGAAPIWIPVHWFVNPALYASSCIVALIKFRPWRADRATALVLAGIFICSLLIYLALSASIQPYSALGLHF